MKRFLKAALNIFTPVRISIISGITIFLALLILGDQGLLQLNKLIFMKKQLEDQKNMLNIEIDKLNVEKDLLHKPKSLEMIIRKELGFIKPGEIIFQEKKNN